MKRFSRAYEWEDTDGSVTVENIRKFVQTLHRHDPKTFDHDPLPILLVLSQEQMAELRLDPRILRELGATGTLKTLFGLAIMERN